jgi:tyrosyl-tRNA synthetase
MNQAPVTKNHPVTDAVREALAVSLRGTDELLPVEDWTYKLARSAATGVPLRVKLGLDPTAPDIHIGHTVVLNKMRQLQDLGHTVARMMERNDFHDRFKSGASISVHEFLYPLMQGYDSVALKSDLELGGTDQKFNLLMGRHLQQEYGQEPQCILTMPLLEGLDGVEKMSKSKNNYIGISEDANTMFAKVLSISDDLMWRWFTLLSFRSEADIAALKAEVGGGRNPKDAKVMLAKEITARFHSAQAADAAEQDFNNRSKGGVPDEIPEVSLSGGPLGIGALLKQAGLAPSTSEAGRLIEGGGVRLDSSVVSDKGLRLEPGTYVVQVGKRKFARVTLS